MTVDEVIDYFGNLNQACIALGIAPQNMTKWKKQGYVPHKQQFKLAYITDGELMPSEEDPHINPRKGKKHEFKQ